MVVNLNTAGGSVGRARCRHRKVVQNPHSVRAVSHDYFLRRSKAGWGPPVIEKWSRHDYFLRRPKRWSAPPVIKKWSRIPTLYTTEEYFKENTIPQFV